MAFGLATTLAARVPALGRFPLALAADWRYQGFGRDLRLDLLRGCAVFAMIVNHVGPERAWLYVITGGNRFFVSAAEVFVFISGLVMGMVYVQTIARSGLATALMRAISRAWLLYVITVAITLSFAALSSYLELPWALTIPEGGLLAFVISVATFRETMHLADIPLMYTVFVLGAVPVFLLLSQGRTLVVLAASWLIWGACQIAPDSAAFPMHIHRNDAFNLPAWQVLFVTGIVVGFHRKTVEGWLSQITGHLRSAALLALAVIVVGLYLVQLTSIDALREVELLQIMIFDKGNVPAVRLVVFALLVSFGYMLTTLAWEPIRRATGWLLLPLGQDALTAYIIHVFVVAITTWLTMNLFQSYAASDVYQTVLQIAALLSVWAIVVGWPRVRERTSALWQGRGARAVSREGVAGLAPQPFPKQPDVRLGRGFRVGPWRESQAVGNKDRN